MKKQSTNEAQIKTLSSKLQEVQELLKEEQKKCVKQVEVNGRLNKSLENALKQAKVNIYNFF